MSTNTDTLQPIADEPKTDVTAEVEVPADIWDRAEQRHQTAQQTGDVDAPLTEYLLDHLLIEYEFTRVDE